MADRPMARRLTQKQLSRLSIYRVDSVCLTPDRVDEALVRRGLLRRDVSESEKPGPRAGVTYISPAGLRALADAMLAGEIDDAIVAMRKVAERRKAAQDSAIRTTAFGSA